MTETVPDQSLRQTQDGSELHRLLAFIKLTRRTPNTITTKTALRHELEQIRDQGLAVNDQELAPDVHSIAAPVRDDLRDPLGSARR